jgi:hypothetical protein
MTFGAHFYVQCSRSNCKRTLLHRINVSPLCNLDPYPELYSASLCCPEHKGIPVHSHDLVSNPYGVDEGGPGFLGYDGY